MSEPVLSELRAGLAQAERILIASHTRPDGDAVGSVLGLGLALQAQGKDIVMALADGVPSALRFMPDSDKIIKKPEGQFDLVVVVDSSNLGRVGNVLDGVGQVDVNIDHHPDNSKFGMIDLVEPTAASTTEILTRHFPTLGLPFTPSVVDNLLTGLITDTQGFKTVNTRPESLRVAADLFEKGAAMTDLYFKAISQRSFKAARYWGAGLSQLERDEQVVWTTLTCKDRKAIDYNGRDDADLVSVLSAIEDTTIALIFIEQDAATVKVSWRTRQDVDVSGVAHQFGGGGHKTAAGAMITGSLSEVQAKVLAATKAIIV